MKVRIDFTVKVDPDRWRATKGLPEDTDSQVRQAVKAWVQKETSEGLSREGILIQ
ncbi:hypothetical protein SEA_MRMIYAGI_62 [Mycobacterium phage MrMiyagi]|uniref:Uncharacterized protein n=1 Tax=Mycobacterium phage MrMiyagi TaxID=2762395 RepID=A0A7G8LPV4_9CAUD|nr:hypothetical protein SEA_MRMIYAGI_62 [Mycobacterium phage MrMiyagi]